ncbi:hypothetical protein CBS9595_004195 [Malassezia furfur]|nr:hypothetical protein CBS9595_004195 [Malassezia furfur]
MARVPFPDVTGLRVRAPARDAFERSTLSARIRRADLEAVEKQHDAAPGTLVAAAFGHVLRAYLLHEIDEVAFDYSAKRTCEIIVRNAPTAHDAIAAISAQLRAPAGAAQGTYALVFAPDLPLESVAPRDDQTTLVVYAHRSGHGDDLALTLAASSAVHIEASAQLMLAQIHAVLRALLQGAPPHTAFAPLAYSSLTHPHPVELHTDMGPGGVDAERLEDQFVRRVREMPDVPALACRTTLEHTDELSYAALDARADAIAQQLWTLGVGYACADDDDDEIVALCMPKTLDMYAAILGVLKAGAAWCPIDEAWPAARQAALLEKSRARVVLVGGAGADAVATVAPAHMDAVHLDAIPPAPQTPFTAPKRSAFRASPERLAYKIWTSGTTGLPKAVGIAHRAAVQGMRALCEAVPTTFAARVPGQLRYLQFAAYVFDLSIFDIFYTWAHAGTVCFAPLALLLNHLAPVARALEVTHTLFTPAVSAMVPRAAIPSMRVLINGGEKLSQAVADEWSRGCTLVNIYGPAEATLSITMHTVPEGDPYKAHNIGYTFPTGLTVVVDRDGQIAPRGAIGELLLGGPQLARGYIGDDDKMRDKFVTHPTLGRVYHTGDLARCLWDGQLEYLGRNDDQVKINGVRIELLEINAAAKTADDRVRDADTVALPGPDDEPRIVSFVVAHADDDTPVPEPIAVREDAEARALAAALRTRVQALLPSYMVPNHFLILPAFPRTSSAKIDRVAIRRAYDALDLVAWEAALHNGAPRADDAGADDDVLAHPLAQALRTELLALCPVRPEQVTAHVPLAALGVNSVRAMALAARLAAFQLGAADFVRHDTIAKLVAAASHAEADAGAQERKAAALAEAYARTFAQLATDDVQVLPATALQQSMLLESAIDARRYWLHRVVPVRRTVSLDALHTALTHVVETYACLRTGFVPVTLPDGADGVPGSTPDTAAYAPLYAALVHRHASPRVDEITVELRAADALDAVRQDTSPTDGAPPVRAVLLHAADGDAVVLVAHHAVYDAETLDRVLHALDAALAGADAPAAPAPPFSAALRDLVPLDDADAARTLAVWRDALAAFPHDQRVAFPRLLDARPPPQRVMQRTTHVAQRPFAALEAAAAHLHTSVRPVAQVAWARVLSAQLGTPDVLLGDAVSLRSAQPHYAAIGGPLLATLPVPVHMAGRAAEAIQAVHRFHTAMLDHAHVPLAFVREMLGVPSDRPLLESVFVLEAEAEHADAGTALALDAPTDLGVAVEHAVALEVRIQRDGAVHLVLNYDTHHVSPAYAALLLAQVDATLTTYIDTPDADALWVPSEAALLGAPPMAPAPPAAVPVTDAFVAQAHKTPDACAVEVLGADDRAAAAPQTLTYAALEHASRAAAAALAQRTAPQAVVGVALPRSADTYVALVAVLRAGRIYLPLDETLPPARRAQLVQDSGCALVVAPTEGDVDDVPCTTVGALVEAGAEHAAPPPPAASDVAYLLYTSGSTGTPKGCLLSHANLGAAIANFFARFEAARPHTLDDGARFLARSAEAFDVHLLEALLPLTVGATIVTMPRARLLRDLGAAMAAARPTHACVVPSLFTTHGRRVVPEDLPTLRLLVVGGEKIDDAILTAWGDAPIPVLNAYGPTEATIGISCATVTRDALATQIGHAFGGNQYVVLTGDASDAARRVALRGEAGELCIVGTHVGLGYLHTPDARAFFAHAGHAAYATGDRARIAPDGSAEYLGRLTASQVKVRGARVELDEVTAHVRETSGVPHVATALLTHGARPEPHLVTFVARAAHAPDGALERADDVCDVHALHARLRAELSTYMVPSVVVPLAYLPLASVSGKVDTHALRAWYEASAMEAIAPADDAPPTTDAERSVAEAVVATLALRTPPGVHADLFSYGLDSIRAVRLAYALEERSVRVPLATVLSTPTIAGIAAHGPKAAAASAPAADPGAGADADADAGLPDGAADAARAVPGALLVAPCVPLQVATLAHTLETPAARLYINHVRIPGGEARVWAQALSRHPIYRTVFAAVGDTFVQVVTSTRVAAATHGGAWTDAACDAVADALIAHLTDAPPVRVVQYDEGVCVSMHHAVYDAASWAMLRAEVERGVPEGDAPADEYAAFARHVAAHEAEATAYWAASLTDMVSTPCPTLTGAYDAPQRAASLRYVVPLALHTLTARAQAAGVSLHALLLAAFCTLLAQYVGEDEATLGLVLSGRLGAARDAEVHGPCTTTVPFRWRAADALATTHRRLYEMLPHQFVRLASVARAVQTPRLFDVLFSYLPERADDGGVRDAMATGYPLALEVHTDAARDELACELVYAPDRVPPAQAALLVAQWGDVLGSAQGARSLVHATPREPADADAFLARFARHAAARPAADAVTMATALRPLRATTWTYAELDRVSTRYAAHLVRHGTVGSAVLVHLTRRIELYAVLLAVWKAQRTYVPLDPTLPAERLAYMIDTVGGGVVVTDGAAPHAARPLTVLALGALEADAGAAPLPPPSLDVPAYILFTSGSTGKPKGVQVSQRALAAAIVSWAAMLPYTPASRLLQLASPGFDVSLFEVCLPLGLGFAVASAPKDVLLADLEHAFHALRITMADVPAALASLLHPARMPPLEWLMSGGDVIDERVVQTWATPPQRLVNAYGPTEGTIGNTLGFMTPTTRRSVVGEVYPATTLLVLPPPGAADAAQPVYAGAIGELAVAGPQVADGYVGAPELTAAKFPTLGGRRVYRTGDRGRLLCDGRVECLGRIERGQVKVNGQRVELDEIAHELAVEPGVRDAQVQYLQHPSHPSKQLVAFLAAGTAPAPAGALHTAEHGAALAAHALAGAAQRLAAYMVPAHTLVLPHALPLTPNNKVDGARLARMYTELDRAALHALRPPADAPHDAPPTLDALVAALGEAGVAEVDVHATFYALGIDSLAAIRVVRTLRERGLATTAAELLQSGSPLAAARRLARPPPTPRDAPGAEAPAPLGLPPRPAFAALRTLGTAYPATPLQAGMLAQTVATDGRLYVHTHTLRVAASADALARAWARLVDANTILRTTFHAADDADVPWVQVVHDAVPPQITHGAYVPPRWTAETIGAQPLHRLHLGASDASGTDATLVLHHALYDAHALDELLDDLDALLGAAPEAPADVRRPPYAALVPYLLSGDAHVAHWADTLRGYVPRPLLAAHTDAAGCTAERPLALSPAEARTACRHAGVSMHALATLAFAQLVAHCTGTPDVCIGQVVSLRADVPDAERVVGPALNTLPVRVDTATADVRAVQRAADAGRTHRHAPLRAIQRAVRAPAALVDTLLDVQQVTSDAARTAVRLVPSDAAHDVQYALNVALVERPTSLTLLGTARTAWADAARLGALLEHMEACLVALVRGVPAPAPHAAPAPRAAPAPDADAPGPDADPAVVATLRTLVAELAGVDEAEVEATTPLLALGLDSIAAVRLAARARREGLALRPADLAQPHVHAIAASYAAACTDADATGAASDAAAAAALEAPLALADAAAALGCDATAIEAVRPVAAGQAMHLAHYVQSSYRVGVFSFAYAAPALDAAALDAAWTALQARHAILRTVFLGAGTPVAPVQVQRTETHAARVLTVRSMPRAALVDAAMRERQRPPAPLTRAIADCDVVQGSDGDAVVLTLFHAMYDAYSLKLLVDDLHALYVAHTQRAVVDDAALSVPGIERLLTAAAPGAFDAPFAAYARAVPCWLRDSSRDETFVQTHTPLGAVRRALDTRTADRVALSSVLLASVANVLHEATQSPPVLGVLQHARLASIADVDRLAAPCLNLVPLTPAVHTSVYATAQAIDEELRTHRAYEQVALDALHRALKLPPTPRFNVVVNVLQDDAGAPAGKAPNAWEPMHGAGLDLLRTRTPLVERSRLDDWDGAHCYPAHPVNLDLAIQGETLVLAMRSMLSEEDARVLLDAIAQALHTVAAPDP